MGWASGSIIADRIWELVREHVPAKDRKRTARKLIGIFEAEDCDTMDECEELIRDAEYQNRGY